MVQVPEKLTEQARQPEAPSNQPPVSTVEPQERTVLDEPEGVQPLVEQPVIPPEIQPTTPVQPAQAEAAVVSDAGQPTDATVGTPEVPRSESSVAGVYADALDDDVAKLAGVESARARETAGP